MMKVPLSIVLILCFVSPVYAELSFNSSIYNEEALTKQLKGKAGEEVVKVLGEPAVKKPDEEGSENQGYWWYSLPEAGIFCIFQGWHGL